MHLLFKMNNSIPYFFEFLSWRLLYCFWLNYIRIWLFFIPVVVKFLVFFKLLLSISLPRISNSMQLLPLVIITLEYITRALVSAILVLVIIDFETRGILPVPIVFIERILLLFKLSIMSSMYFSVWVVLIRIIWIKWLAVIESFSNSLRVLRVQPSSNGVIIWL